jgi:predicted HAD superfamily Cof-like phosphohydrolase
LAENTLSKLFIKAAAADVAEFYERVLSAGFLVERHAPKPLTSERAREREAYLTEEAVELGGAVTVEAQADAALDSVFFAVGTLVEIGIPFAPGWEEVVRANLEKRAGANETRGLSHDAVKPSGFAPPDHSWMSSPAMPGLIAAAKVSALRRGDYGSVWNYFPLGMASHAQMVSLKAQRFLQAVATGASKEKMAEDLRDLMCYAAYAWMEASGLRPDCECRQLEIRFEKGGES